MVRAPATTRPANPPPTGHPADRSPRRPREQLLPMTAMPPHPFFLCACLLTLSTPSVVASTPTGASPDRWTAPRAVQFAPNAARTRAAGERISAAEADIRAARAAFLPQLGVSGEYSRTDNPCIRSAIFSTGDSSRTTSTSTIPAPPIPCRPEPPSSTASTTAVTTGPRSPRPKRRPRRRNTTGRRSAPPRVRGGTRLPHHPPVPRTRCRRGRAQWPRSPPRRRWPAPRHAAGTLLREEVLNLEVQQARAEEQRIQARHGLELARRGFSNLLGLSGGEVHPTRWAARRRRCRTRSPPPTARNCGHGRHGARL